MSRMPAFLGPPTAFDASASVTQASQMPPRGGFAPAKSIAFSIQSQGLPNWCWAAVSASVAAYFGSASAWTQCKIASSCLGATCCSNPVPDPTCDDTYYLDKALQVVGHLARGPGPIVASGPAQMPQIQTEINSSRPLCAYIDWGNGTDGHFVVLSGYDPASSEVRIDDPDGATQTWMAYSAACTSYPGGGTWGFTYWTS
jgi:hypothetical protein